MPTFCGAVRSAPDGSDIDITITLEGADSIIIIVYHVFILWALIIGISVGFVLFLFILALACVADGLGYYMSFIRGFQFFESDVGYIFYKE